MNYETRIRLAIEKTKALGLKLDADPLPFKAPLSFEQKQQALQLCVGVLWSLGYRTSSDLASKCTPVHLTVQYHLKNELGLESYITIGDRYWDDYVYCPMSYEYIERELQSPNIEAPLSAHIWLTLSDGTILDCTAEAHGDVLFNRGEHSVDMCLMLVEAGAIEDAKAGYHRPYLLGTDFLEKTGTCKI